MTSCKEGEGFRHIVTQEHKGVTEGGGGQKMFKFVWHFLWMVSNMFLSIFLFVGIFFELLSVFFKSFCLFVCLLFSISYKCFGLSMFVCLCYFGTSYECFGLSMFVCLCYFAESNRKSKSNDKRLNQGRSNRRRFFVVVVAQIITFTSDQTKK